MTAQPPPRQSGIPLTVETTSHDGVAVTTHHLASEAAVAIMARGGNAVDAAIAANAVVGVVLPDTCGLGGDLFALVHEPGAGTPAALNASGRAGSGASAAQLRAAGHDVVPLRGPVSVTIPGCVDGWEALLDRYGSMSLAEVLAPAVDLASGGFPVAPELADSLAALAELLRGEPSAAELYPNGVTPRAGEVLKSTALGRTLAELGHSGRDGFYNGKVGEAISTITGGVISAADLGEQQADWVDPLGMRLGDLNAWTIPPNSQGHLTLTASWIAERLPFGDQHGTAAHHHALIEAYRAVAWERDLLTTDPETMPLSTADLVSPARLDSRLARIDAEQATPWPSSHPAPGGTTYLCVRDGSGMGVSLIQSNFHGIGSGVGAGDTGVWLQNRGAGFSLEPGHRNELAPGRRPLHTLSPTLWTDGGALRLLLGTRGGDYQPQLLLQIASHRMAHDLPLAEAMAEPRWIVDHWGPDEPHVVRVESRMPTSVIDGLRTRGHAVEVGEAYERGWGPAAAIEIGEHGVTGAADPRVSTAGAAATS